MELVKCVVRNEWRDLLAPTLISKGFQAQWTCGSIADILVPLHGIDSVKSLIIDYSSGVLSPSNWKDEFAKSKNGFLWNAYIILGDSPTQQALDAFTSLQIQLFANNLATCSPSLWLFTHRFFPLSSLSRGFETNPVLFPVRNHGEMLQHLHDFVCKFEWHRPVSKSVSISAAVAVRNSLKALASLSSKTTPSQAWDEAQQLLAHFGSVNNIFAAVHDHCTSSAFYHNTIYQNILEQPSLHL